MNEETKILQYKLDKDYLTIDDVIRYGDVRLVIGMDQAAKYWFRKNKDEDILVLVNKIRT